MPRPGHDGKLTNRNCLAYQGDACVTDQVFEYDLNDPKFRGLANDLGFVCKTGGAKMYQICKDQPGFCRMSTEHKCILGICWTTKTVQDYIPITPYQHVLDLAVQCFNENVYPWLSL